MIPRRLTKFLHVNAKYSSISNRSSFQFRTSVAGSSKHSTCDSIDASVGTFGEDAFFQRHDALGVSDGVGGWSKTENAESGRFAHSLMSHCLHEIERCDDVDDEERFGSFVSGIKVLQTAYRRTKRDFEDRKKAGSATACIVQLVQRQLLVTNLGDCGVLVMRQGECVFRSEEQQHSFNCPLQLGTQPTSNTPTDADVISVHVKRGDIVVLGTDGLFDNLFDAEIVLTDGLPQMALQLANKARDVSLDQRVPFSPFGSRALRDGMYHQGGKPDDITVVVGVVVDLEDSPDRR